MKLLLTYKIVQIQNILSPVSSVPKSSVCLLLRAMMGGCTDSTFHTQFIWTAVCSFGKHVSDEKRPGCSLQGSPGRHLSLCPGHWGTAQGSQRPVPPAAAVAWAVRAPPTPSSCFQVLFIYSKSPMYKPSSCELSKMQTCICTSNHVS